MDPDEEVVMTPAKKGRTTLIKIEKKKKQAVDHTQVAHTAGGQHTGLVINKRTDSGDSEKAAELQLEFKCFLIDQKTQTHVPESRILKFWFAENTDYLDKVTGAYEFFKELVKPDNFPRDYVGFIKKVMKQVQHERYRQIKKVDVELTQLEVHEAEPPSPGMTAQQDSRPKEVIVQEQVLLTLESAYPNILPVEDLCKLTGSDEQMVTQIMCDLQGRNLIKEIEPGKFVRKVLDEQTEVKVVQNMTAMATGGSRGDRPTVAIITSKYNEKLAVDAMMEDKTTFVRYKTEGESNVYTIGYIGGHKCVSTKLPQIGRAMAAQISSGNTTTRLLGTFGDVEHVFLVGVAGGVPHYSDFYQHVRLGDVVVSTSNEKGFMFIYCDDIIHDEQKGSMQYQLKSWAPSELDIQDIVVRLLEQQSANPDASPWTQFVQDGQTLLQGQEVNFSRPDPGTDKLYMNIGGSDVIEVGHPPVPDEARSWYREGVPRVLTGAVGSGRPVVKDDALRMDFAARQSCVAFDTEFDQVLESIVGNRKDSFVFIRGIADYLDGTKNVQWQPYSALSAAAFMKAVIKNLPVPGK